MLQALRWGLLTRNVNRIIIVVRAPMPILTLHLISSRNTCLLSASLVHRLLSYTVHHDDQRATACKFYADTATRVLTLPVYPALKSSASSRCVRRQGVSVAQLTALQELHISVGHDNHTFNLEPAGLPPSLRRLKVLNGCPRSMSPKLIVHSERMRIPWSGPGELALDVDTAASAPATSAPTASASTASSPAVTAPVPPAAAAANSAPTEPAAPAPLGAPLLSLNLDCIMLMVPAPWPLAASCIVTLRTGFFMLRGDHPPAIGTEREIVSAPHEI